MTGLVEESTVILWKINQAIPSPGVSGESLLINYWKMFYYKIKLGLKEYEG